MYVCMYVCMHVCMYVSMYFPSFSFFLIVVSIEIRADMSFYLKNQLIYFYFMDDLNFWIFHVEYWNYRHD